MITWSYTHTGGLPLTSLNLTYAYTDGTRVIQEEGQGVELDDIDHTLPRLVAGRTYNVIVGAGNSEGSALAQCEPVVHLIGKL